MSLMSYIVSQFKNPRGMGGQVAGWLMANRPSNRKRNFWTVDLLDIQAKHRVLEIGFGPGIALERVASLVTAGEVIGIDQSRAMRRQAARRNQRAIARGSVRLDVATAEQLPPDLGEFDRIYSVNVVQFWGDQQSVFSRLFSRLGPNGMIATTYQPRHRGATSRDADIMATRIAASMAAAGFDDVRTERLDLKPVPAVCVIGRRPHV